jgi:hypothetical protein
LSNIDIPSNGNPYLKDNRSRSQEPSPLMSSIAFPPQDPRVRPSHSIAQ